MSDEQKPEEAKTVKVQGKNTGMAIVAYILFFIPLLTDAKNDPFVKFHVKQGLVLFILAIAINILAGVVPVLGWSLISPLGGLFTLVLFVMGIMHAINGEEKELPLVGQFAKNFKF
jgi:uncharacterized membrane protein